MQNKNNNLEQLKNFSEHFHNLVREIESLIENGQTNSAKTNELAALTQNLQKFFRESYQEVQKSKIQTLINRLKDNLKNHQGIGDENLALLREVMIGDADNYIKNETNTSKWLEKLKEYSSLIDELSHEALSGNYLFKMTGKSVTASRLAQDLNFYFQQAERIKNFEYSISDGIDNVESKFLIETLEYKLHSADS